MAKTLVGLYDTLADAEKVVQDLVVEGFPLGSVQIVSLNADSHHDAEAYVGTWITADECTGIIDRLIDLGVPAHEARVYAEGIQQSGALVIIESSDEWAERGLKVMNRLQALDEEATPSTGAEDTRAVNRQVNGGRVRVHTRKAVSSLRGQGDRNAEIPATPMHTTRDAPVTLEQAKAGSGEGRKGVYVYAAAAWQPRGPRATDREVQEDLMPAYRYGYDLADDKRFQDQNWAELEAGIRYGWERQYPGTWEQCKEAIRNGWDTVRGVV